MSKTVTIKPASQKLRMLYERHRYKVLKGGRGSAKSWGVAEALTHYTNTYKTRVLCCREIQKSIQESAKKLIEDTIERYGLASQYEIQKTTIVHKRTRSEFIFEGLKANTNKIKSLEGIDLCWVEEAETVSEESWQTLIPTIRKPGSEIWITFNPRYVVDPTWQMFVESPRPGTAIEHFTYADNPYFPDDLRREMEFDKARDEALYRFIWEGEPMGDEYNTFIPPKLIKDAQERIPLVSTETPVAGLDVARYGGDSTELVIRSGNRITHTFSLASSDLVTVSDWAADHLVTSGCKTVVIDGTGVGAGVVDILQKRYGQEIQVVEFAGASKPQDERYANARAETWDRMRTWVRESGQLPKNDKADGLTLITYFYNTQNKLQLESKEQMRRRGVPSPDWGDALSMTFADAVTRPTFDRAKFARALMRR